MAADAQRGDDARPVEDRVPGGDRCGVASSSTSGASTSRFAQELYREQPISTHGTWNQSDYRGLEGLRLRGHAVQLHRHRRQPAGGAGADGLHGGVEAGVERDAQRALHHEAARGRGPAAGRHQLRARRRRGGLDRRARSSRLRRHSLHRIDRRLQRHVAARRRRTSASTAPIRASSARPAARTSSSCTPSADPQEVAVGARARRVRVPGTEVLGGEPRLRAEVAVAGRARSDARR